MKCTNALAGCEWIGELGSLDKHSIGCGFVILECENGCLNQHGETTTILHKDSEQHLSSECPNRSVKCELCKREGQYDYITDEHRESCPEVIVPCPNDGCDVLIKRCEIEGHCEVCLHKEIHCKYVDIGCTVYLPRKHMAEHEASAQSHLDIALGTVSSLKKEQEAMKETIAISNSQLFSLHSAMSGVEHNVESIYEAVEELQENDQNGTGFYELPQYTSYVKGDLRFNEFTFEMANFQQLKEEKTDFYSPPFYTSPGAYKICARVIPITGGTHVGVAIHLMLGENDNILTWPFQTAKIKIELLNQLTNGNHHTHTILFNPDKVSATCQRVVGRERSPRGNGTCKFISHKSLNGRYLVNDTLFFRVTVLEAPSHKAWLACNAVHARRV